MNPKIIKLTSDIEKTKAKIAELQTRLKKMEQQKTELENTEIVAVVRALDISPDKFPEIVREFSIQGTLPAPGSIPALRPEVNEYEE